MLDFVLRCRRTEDMVANVRLSYWRIWALCFLQTTAWSMFCPVRSPFDQLVYVTDRANQSFTGLTRPQCGMECAFFATLNAVSATCRSYSYNSISGNCSIFNYEPKTYSIATSEEMITYQVSIQIF